MRARVRVAPPVSGVSVCSYTKKSMLFSMKERRSLPEGRQTMNNSKRWITRLVGR